MIAHALVSQPVAEGVALLRLEETDVPLEPVLRYRLVDMTLSAAGAVPAPPGFPPIEEVGVEDDGEELGSLQVRLPSGEFRGEGLLVYEATHALVDFLIDAWLPAGRSEVDRVVADLRARRIDARGARGALHRLFDREVGGRRRFYSPAVERPIAAVARAALRQSSLVPVRAGGGEAYLRRALPSQTLALVAEYPSPQFPPHLAADASSPASLRSLRRTTSTPPVARLADEAPRHRSGAGLAGRGTEQARSPRWLFALVEDGLLVGWDGRALAHAASSRGTTVAHLERAVGREAARALAERGRARIVEAERLLPRADARPCRLVRVPSRAEAEELCEAPLPEGAPFDRALLVQDARGAFAGIDALPIEEDPAVAAALLARVERGLYVPGDVGAAEWLAAWTEEAPYLALLCEIEAC